MSDQHTVHRRRFLRFLAASPLLAPVAGPRGMGEALAEELAAFEITTPAQALNVFDLESLARAKLPTAHFAYLATGVEGDMSRWRIAPPA